MFIHSEQSPFLVGWFFLDKTWLLTQKNYFKTIYHLPKASREIRALYYFLLRMSPMYDKKLHYAQEDT